MADKIKKLSDADKLERIAEFQQLWSSSLSIADIADTMQIEKETLSNWAKQLRDKYGLPFPKKGRGKKQIEYDSESLFKIAAKESGKTVDSLKEDCQAHSQTLKGLE